MFRMQEIKLKYGAAGCMDRWTDEQTESDAYKPIVQNAQMGSKTYFVFLFRVLHKSGRR